MQFPLNLEVNKLPPPLTVKLVPFNPLFIPNASWASSLHANVFPKLKPFPCVFQIRADLTSFLFINISVDETDDDDARYTRKC